MLPGTPPPRLALQASELWNGLPGRQGAPSIVSGEGVVCESTSQHDSGPDLDSSSGICAFTCTSRSPALQTRLHNTLSTMHFHCCHAFAA